MKIAMIGGKTSTIGFKALGVETFDVPKPQDATEVFGGVRPSRYAIIFMTEPVYEVLRSEVEELRDERLPVITVIPAVAGSNEVGMEETRAMVEKAVGADVLLR
jgi:V/A-type H+/Na+-transporting ATPase subunit F